MLSRRGRAALGVAVAFVVLGVAISAGRLLEVGLALAALVVIDALLAFVLRPASLEIIPCADQAVVAAGADVELVFSATNRSRRPTKHLVFELPLLTEERTGARALLGAVTPAEDLGPNERCRVRSTLGPLPRGKWTATSVIARSAGPLGFAERRRTLPAELSVTVHPAPDPVPTGVVPGPAPGVADGADEERVPVGVRAFTEGDALRLVHWPSSLKRGTLMVRELAEHGPDQTVMVLDLRPEVHEGRSFESMLEQAAAILLDPPGGSPVRMITTAGADSGRLATVEGRRSALQALATIQPEPGPAPNELTQRLSAARQARRLVVLSGPRVAAAVGSQRRRKGASWLCGQADADAPFSPNPRADQPSEAERARPNAAATLARTLAVGLATAWVGRLFIGKGWIPSVLIGLGLVLVASLVSAARSGTSDRRRLTWLGGALVLGTLIDTWLVTGTGPGIAEARLILSSLRRAPGELRLVGVPAPELAPLVIGLALLGALSLAIAEALGHRHRFGALAPVACLVAFSGAEHLGNPNAASALWIALIGLAAWASVTLERPLGEHQDVLSTRATLRRGMGAVASAGVAIVIGALGAMPFLGALGGGIVKVHPDSASLAVSIDPLVSLVPDLEQVGGPVLFTVKTTSPDYWRLETLTTFNGVTWLPSQVSTNSGILQAGATTPSGLPHAISPDPHGTFTVERFHLEHLASAALPVGGDPIQVSGAPLVSWHPREEELDTVDGLPLPLGTTYQVLAFQPAYTAALLANATVPADPPAGTLTLPPVPAKVRQLAEAIVAHAPTPYAKALAIQTYLRTHEHYDLNVPSGPGNPLERFLFVTHEGYCQQFAGSFGVLARLVGLPTRLAVGFTPGTLVGHDTYQVSAADVHTWPEVDFSGLGWVRFEPTPGRGAPGEQAYDGVKPSQVGATKPTSVAPVRYPASATTTKAAPSTTTASLGSSKSGGRPPSASTATSPQATLRSHSVGHARGLVSLVVALGVALALGLVVALRRRSWRRRREHRSRRPAPSWWLGVLALPRRFTRRPEDLFWPRGAERSRPVEQARRSWERALFEAERWVDHGHQQRPKVGLGAVPTTPRQRTTAVADELGPQARFALLEVLGHAERAAFGPAEDAFACAVRAEQARAELHRALRATPSRHESPEPVG